MSVLVAFFRWKLLGHGCSRTYFLFLSILFIANNTALPMQLKEHRMYN